MSTVAYTAEASKPETIAVEMSNASEAHILAMSVYILMLYTGIQNQFWEAAGTVLIPNINQLFWSKSHPVFTSCMFPLLLAAPIGQLNDLQQDLKWHSIMEHIAYITRKEAPPTKASQLNCKLLRPQHIETLKQIIYL